ncbi:DEAD/DEAH box helicase [Meiothermus sp.]|uniref:DEAD/DEAH box helicase n=1 Tax=Meiothermus sp. TaxID=1955249 RepID=UPI0021DBE5F1|nr:DEAD/DEAH box helicase [Meiothermus sp.]GIW24015.1 MAG: helicase [Meiothermus sp.]
MLPKELLPYSTYAEWLKELEGYAGQIAFVQVLPTNPPQKTAYDGAFSGVLMALALQPFTFQAQALEHLEQGHHLVLSTSTASGKSLVFQVPVLKATLEGATSLLLYPTKALAHDQLGRLRQMAKPLGVDDRIYPYDGDTSDAERKKAREKGRALLTNPDMLHFGLLPRHGDWAIFLSKLRYIVLDELHAYRGVFGTHTALILQRLLRLAWHYGATPQVIAASATIANPSEHAHNLTGLGFHEVVANPSRAEREFVVWVPKALDKEGKNRRSANLEAALLARHAAEQGLKTLIFTNARRTAELVARYAADERVRPYRAGYTAAERRKLEQALQEGTVRVLVSTSALELGVDIGGLDAVILLGYPGSVSSFWQRAGRAGRSSRRALVLWIPREDPLDAFFEQHPELLLKSPPESAVADPDNPILYPLHAHCAARELPIALPGAGGEETPAKPTLDPLYKPWLNIKPPLVERYGRLYSPKRSPHRDLILRGLGQGFSLRDNTGQLLGTLDERQAYWEAHPGAVYLHQGESYLVRNLDPEKREIVLLPGLEDYYTQPRAQTEIEVLQGEEILEGIWVGPVLLRERVTGYVKKRFMSETVLEEVLLVMPELTFQTEAMWFHPCEGLTVLPTLETGEGIEARWPDQSFLTEAQVPSAIHALEHTLIGLLPLFVLAERQDVGGVSYPFYPRPLPSGSGPTIFIYDGYPGGVGYARAAARQFSRWVNAARDLLQGCPCEEGCPRCILSPKCGNGNQFLDKQTAWMLAEALSSRYSLRKPN